MVKRRLDRGFVSLRGLVVAYGSIWRVLCEGLELGGGIWVSDFLLYASSGIITCIQR